MPVTFSITTDTTIGQSVFVVGNLAELGNWDPTRAIKMVPGDCSGSNCLWLVTLGLPEGVAYEYKFVKRADCASCLGNPANIVWEPGANRTNSTPAGPAVPLNGKSVFYCSGWTNPSLVYSNWLTGWTSVVMTAFAPGRSAGETIWRADGINVAGQTNLIFLFTDNNNHYDNPDGVSGRNYETPLDAFVVQDGQIYNYWPAPSISAPWVETFPFNPSNGLQTRDIHVYLPRGFSSNLTKRYPVLYMNDGQNLFLGAGPYGGWNADTNATYLTRFGKMRELIIVGINNDPNNRGCEYTPCPICSGTNLAYAYADFVINQLKPYIDSQYPTTANRTLTDADNTGILGSSRGGLCATFLGWEHSDVFGKIGGMSSSFWACETTLNNLAIGPKHPVRIYLDSGTVGDFNYPSPPACSPCYDASIYGLAARDNLLKNGYVLNVDLFHWIGYGDQHTEYYWNRRLPVCYQFLFPTSDEPNTILDSVAPMLITSYQMTNNAFTVSWPSYRARTYSLLGCTNLGTTLSNWSPLLTTPPEVRPWNYLTAQPTNGFQYFRVMEHAVPYWPN